jgi:hypothetical protein
MNTRNSYEGNALLTRRKALITGIGVAGAALGLSDRHIQAEEVDHHKVQEALIKKHWEMQDEVYGKIADVGMEDYFHSLPDKEEAFFSKEEAEKAEGITECCSDEGIREVRSEDGEKMILERTPGSGILHAISREDKNPFAPEFIEETALNLVESGVTEVSSHTLCGALAAVYNARLIYLRSKGMEAQAKHLEEMGSEEWGRRWTDAVVAKMKEISKGLGKKGSERIRSRFIDKLDRPKTLHPARDLYIVDSRRFDASYKGLPQGFVEHPERHVHLDKLLSHVDVLRSIAFDTEHGMGSQFNTEPKNQFLITVIAETRERIAIIQAHAEKKLKELPKEDAERIRIEGVLV